MRAVVCIFLALWSLFGISAVRADMEIRAVVPGQLYRSHPPKTPEDYAKLQALGIRTVLDIRKFKHRAIEKEAQELAARGIQGKNVPFSFHPEKDGSAEQVFQALINQADYPLCIHCNLDRDRSSLAIGLFRIRCQGWSQERAFKEMREFGFKRHLLALNRYFWEYAGNGCPKAR